MEAEIRILAGRVGETLIRKNISLSACESCTGGMFSSAVCGVPGISKVFDSGLVTYSNSAKIRTLGVREETIRQYTEISSETAAEMAEGLAERTGSELCISITGVAGPEDLSSEKPAGFAYVGLSVKGGPAEVSVYRVPCRDRECNRERMTVFMLNIIQEAAERL
ncbi:MAG: CinA family protein [Lachnospiraceae bacterium]|nr:CinA family protein [Lachnospiraceae bacterium]